MVFTTPFFVSGIGMSGGGASAHIYYREEYLLTANFAGDRNSERSWQKKVEVYEQEMDYWESRKWMMEQTNL